MTKLKPANRVLANRFVTRLTETDWAFTDTALDAAFDAAREEGRRPAPVEGEPVAWIYIENRTPSGREVRRVRLSEQRQPISDEDRAEYEITETPLYAAPPAPEAKDVGPTLENVARLVLPEAWVKGGGETQASKTRRRAHSLCVAADIDALYRAREA